MPAVIESPLDVVALSRAIAHAATSDQKATGRRCRLADPVAVQRFLLALFDGQSLYAASAAAGFSEGAVRRWLKLGTAPGARGICADLASAVTAIRVARLPPVPEPLDPAVAAAAAAADRARQDQQAAAERARQVVADREGRIAALAHQLFTLTDQLGLVFPPDRFGVSRALNRAALSQQIEAVRSGLDAELRAAAPAVETREARRARYLRWRQLTRRNGLNAMEFEMACDTNFRNDRDFH
jgi:hypothetical protein